MNAAAGNWSDTYYKHIRTTAEASNRRWMNVQWQVNYQPLRCGQRGGASRYRARRRAVRRGQS